MNNHTEKMAAKLAALHMHGKEVPSGYYTENTLVKLHEILGPQSFKYFIQRNTILTTKQGHKFISDLGYEGVHVVNRHISARRLIIDTKTQQGIIVEDVLFFTMIPEFVITTLGGEVIKIEDVVKAIEIKEISYTI